MMRIAQAQEPSAFHRDVTVRGRKYLEKHPNTPGSKLPDYWNDYRDEFFEAYHGICAYTVTRIIDGHGFQMDHYRPKGVPRYRHLAYAWSNFRLISNRSNLKKGTARVADPFAIPDGACRISFLRGRITLNAALPANERELLVKTIRRLGLNEGASQQARTRAYRQYRNHVLNRRGDLAVRPRDCIDIEHLTRWYPFVASEMLRLGRIEPEDRERCRQILSELGFAMYKRSVKGSDFLDTAH